jgi:hypothetical protein
MLPNDFWATATSSFGLAETGAMILGGFLFGASVIWLSPPVRSVVTTTPYLVLILTMLGLVFFISRGAALYFDGSALWPRNVGFGGLWVVYCLAMGAGISVRRRLG